MSKGRRVVYDHNDVNINVIHEVGSGRHEVHLFAVQALYRITFNVQGTYFVPLHQILSNSFSIREIVKTLLALVFDESERI